MTADPDAGDPHYLAHFHLPERRTVQVGALGSFEFPSGDYAYVGRAERGYDARLARHARTSDKSLRWHVDYLRARSRWVQARTPDAPSECHLAERLADLRGAARHVDGFGASDCGCDGHLVSLPEGTRALPGDLWRGDGLEAEFVDRPNRFVLRARLDGERVRAYLPNTARLTELLEPGRTVLLEPADDPERKTDYTVKRFWDGTWVSVEATRAERMLEDVLESRGALPGLGSLDGWTSQVETAGHRFDFRLELDGGEPVWLEVKSLSRNFDGTAVLSGTPSRRGVDHLAALSQLAESGERTAVAFVIQRDDARRLAIVDPGVDAHIDDAWIDAVRRARSSGVAILAFGCRITPSNGWIDGRLPLES